MENFSHTNSRDLGASRASSFASSLRRVFVGEEGLRAGWSAVLFVGIYLILDDAGTAVLSHFVSLQPSGPIPLSLGLVQELFDVVVVFAATWVMARIEKRRLLAFGYLGDHRVLRMFSGVVWGLLSLSVLIGILWKAGLVVFEGLSLTGITACKYAFGWALVFLLVGIFEESLLRGYLQFTLSRGIGFWPAALLLSAAFALWHTSNGGESPLGLLVVGLGGLVFCLSLWYTKSLCWAVGFHAGWDWGQSFLYGTPDSGLLMKNTLLASHPAGNPLWSGGATGPEGSLLILPLLIAMATGMWIWWGRSSRLSRRED